MRYHRLGSLMAAADVKGTSGAAAWRNSRRARLERWADALELRRTRCLRTVDDSGFWVQARGRRADDSPLSVAFEDWALRAEGLAGDSIADAADFFELSGGQIRRLAGASRHGESVPAAAVAAALRTMAEAAEGPALSPAGVVAAGASALGVMVLMLAVS